MSAYVVSRVAKQDLVEIWEYLAERNLDAADKMIEKIRETLEKLAANPGIGHIRPDLTKRKVLFWPVHSYLIVYAEGPSLEVVRILSGFRDIVELLDS